MTHSVAVTGHESLQYPSKDSVHRDPCFDLSCGTLLHQHCVIRQAGNCIRTARHGHKEEERLTNSINATSDTLKGWEFLLALGLCTLHEPGCCYLVSPGFSGDHERQNGHVKGSYATKEAHLHHGCG